MLVSKLIDLSLKQLGILASGETANDNEIADAIDALRGLLAQWSTDRLMIYKIKEIEVPLNGIGSYTLQEKIESVSDQAELDDQSIILIRDINNTGNYKPVIYIIDQPFWHFNVREDAQKLTLKTFTLPEQLEAQDEIEVPFKYERPLILSLALEIAPMFGTEPSALLLKNQASALDLLKRSNSVPMYTQNTLQIGVGYGRY